MKALMYMGEKQLELQDIPAPSGELVLRVTVVLEQPHHHDTLLGTQSHVVF